MSEQINELATALSKAQGAMKGAVKDSANPFFKSKYADLASVWEACRGALESNGLSVAQLPGNEGPRVTLTTLLSHSSGQWIRSVLSATPKDEGPQALGSVVSYLRRYALASMVGIATVDDDGEAAQGRSGHSERQDPPRQMARETQSIAPPVPKEADVAGTDKDPIFWLSEIGNADEVAILEALRKGIKKAFGETPPKAVVSAWKAREREIKAAANA